MFLALCCFAVARVVAVGVDDNSKELNFWNPGELGEPKQLIVKFNKKSLGYRNLIADRNKADIEDRVDDTRSFIVTPEKGVSLEKLEQQLDQEPGIETVEPDYPAKAFAQTETWGYSHIKAAEAKATGSVSGDGVTVAVIDTGVDYDHVDLSDNIWENSDEVSGNSVDDDSNGYVDDVRGYDFIGSNWSSPSPDNNPDDVNGHGTHVAGIVAAEDNTTGVVGVAHEATIMPVRALDDDGSGTMSAIASSIYYAVDNGADVINMSLGSSHPSSTLKTALDYAADNDVLVVTAAGNDYGFNLYLSYPAAYANVISVAAHDQNSVKTWWSNYGKVEVTAPGNQILSSVPNDQYATYSGTSMASPFIAGQAALLIDKHPSLDAASIRQIIEDTAADQYRSGHDIVYGNGLANLEDSVMANLKSLSLNSSSSRIVADNGGSITSSAILSARLIDSSGVPVSGQLVDFSVDRGDLSSDSGITDVDGVASVTLTADNINGLVTATVSSSEYNDDSIQIIAYNNKVYLDNVRILKNGGTGTTFAPNESVTIGGNLYTWAYVSADDESQAERQVDIAYSVKDSNGNSVDSFTGVENDIDVNYTQSLNISETIPADLTSGRYELEVVVTDDASGKTTTATSKFTIGSPNAHVLVVPNYQSSTVDTYATDSYKITQSPQFQHLINELDELDISYDIWPSDSAHPSYDNVKLYPIVFATSAWQDSTSYAPSYLNSGGNLYVSGNTDFISGPDQGDNSELFNGWCAGSFSTSTLGFSCAELKQYPDDVAGIAGLFDGMSFDIDAFNLSGDGRLNQMYADEIVASGTTPVLSYSDGVHTPAVAGVVRDNGFSKMLVTGFGLEGINNSAGYDNRGDFVEAIYEYFKPDTVQITSAASNPITRGSTLTVNGGGFVGRGKTTVMLGGVELTNVSVKGRTQLTAKVPSNMTTGSYSLHATNPFGQSATMASEVSVAYPSPKVTKFTKFVSNDKTRTITIRGSNFRKGASVKISKKLLKKVKVHSSTKVTAQVPAKTKPGTYTVKVTNNDGKSGSKSKFKVRYGFGRNLSLGSSGSDVKELQRRLQSGSYFPKNAVRGNYFGHVTRNAVLEFQRAKKLPRTGVVSGSTRTYLNTK